MLQLYATCGRVAKFVMILGLSGLATFNVHAAEWNTVQDTSLVIREGGPLDFSKWLPAGVAGAQGRVIVGPQGRFVFANKPDTPAKLSCVSLAWSPATGGYPDKPMADLFARQVKVHGYNLVRIHYAEALLMSNRMGDFDFDPVQLDRFYYFLAALKREGVYWVIDAMTSENGAYGNVMPHRWIQQYNLKYMVHVDDKAKAHWRTLIDKLYVPKNPYTGLSILADPALAGMVLLNEGGMNFLAATREGGIWRAELQPLFVAFLKRRYPNDAEWSKAWGDVRGTESLAKGTVILPEVLRKYSPRMADFQRFLTELETNTGRWMTSHLRERGYVGPLTSYDNWLSTQSNATRSSFNWIDMHAYHDESLGFSPGTTIAQTSSTVTAARYARWLATSRQSGKPYSVTEYGQPFWNRFRFEAGAIIPAMAAFQGWDFACLHGEGGIDLTFYSNASRKSAIHPYGVGIDPVSRAGETLSALLYMRGDVSPAINRVAVSYLNDAAFKGNYLDGVSEDISMLSWITGVELLHPGGKSTVPIKQTLLPLNTTELTWGLSRTAIQVPMTLNDFALDTRLSGLRKVGVVDATNRTSVSAGVYESDTKQLLMDLKNNRFTVITPRTEAVTLGTASSNVALKNLKVIATTSPGLVSASALDDVPLVQSKKILLIFATDAQNTGMKFADSERRELVSLGTIPVQLQRSVANLSLALGHATEMKLTALTLNGELGDKIPLTRSGNIWTMKLDSAMSTKGPTTFFLLEVK